jgi:hypothetical protein
MVVQLGQVRGLAQAFADSLERLGSKEREQQPSAAYAENFNNVLALAKEVAPEVDARLWPKPVETYEGSTTGKKLARARYAELATYASQVLELLPLSM